MANKIALYIHWPFCLHKCPYCDFNSHVPKIATLSAETIIDDSHQWVDTYLANLELFREFIQQHKIGSIFFGGGTPSLMHANVVSTIIDAIDTISTLDQDIEITLEANPTSFETRNFQDLKTAGINRLSIGVQSFNNEDLRILGRQHSAQSAINTIETAQKYFDNYSFDLIYARPHQSLQDWKDELETALSLANQHISLYQLVIEKGSAFYKMHKDGLITELQNDIASDMYLYTQERLTHANFLQYEISNFAKDGFTSKHNEHYWNYKPYIGIGPGAHSRIHSTQNAVSEIAMTYNPYSWKNKIAHQPQQSYKSTPLTSSDIANEIIMLGLRTTKGFSIQQLKKLTNKNIEEVIDVKQKEELIKHNVITETNTHIFIKANFMHLHSYITSRLTK